MTNTITIPFELSEFPKHHYGGIYFIYGILDKLLYIGQTNDFTYRLSEYYRKQTHLSFLDVSKVEILRIDNSDERKSKEKILIREYLPPMNYACTGGLSERCKSRKKNIIKTSINIDEDLYDKMKVIGDKEDRNFSNQISKLVREYLENEGKK